MNANGNENSYKRLPVLPVMTEYYESHLIVNEDTDIEVQTGKTSVAIEVCSNDVPVSAHTLVVSIVSTDPNADPMLVASKTEITFDSETICDHITIEATNTNALVDRTATLSIVPASTSDDMYADYSGVILVVEAVDLELESAWVVSDVTEFGATITGAANQASTYYLYLAPKNIYDVSM